MPFESIKLDLSLPQVQKLAHGKTISINHSQIGKGHDILLDKKKVTKIKRAHASGKGCRLQMTAQEFDVQGGSFLDLLRKAANFVKDKIIDSDFYQKNVKPVTRELVNTGVNLLAPRLGPASSILRKGIDVIGDRTGAFGVLTDGTPMNPALPLPDFSKPDPNVIPRRNRLVRGSVEAAEWGKRMRELKAQKRATSAGSFRVAGSGSFR